MFFPIKKSITWPWNNCSEKSFGIFIQLWCTSHFLISFSMMYQFWSLISFKLTERQCSLYPHYLWCIPNDPPWNCFSNVHFKMVSRHFLNFIYTGKVFKQKVILGPALRDSWACSASRDDVLWNEGPGKDSGWELQNTARWTECYVRIWMHLHWTNTRVECLFFQRSIRLICLFIS